MLSEGKIFFLEGKIIFSKGKILLSEGKILFSEGKILLSEGKILLSEGKILPSEGKILLLSAAARPGLCPPSGPRTDPPTSILADSLGCIFLKKFGAKNGEGVILSATFISALTVHLYRLFSIFSHPILLR